MKVDAKLRQRGEKDQPPKLLCYIAFFFCFCFENAKKLGRSDDAKRRKKRGWPNYFYGTLADFVKTIVIYSHQVHPHTKPDEPRCTKIWENWPEALRVGRP